MYLYQYVSFDTLHKKLYEREIKFNNFEEIAQNDLERIKKEATEFAKEFNMANVHLPKHLKKAVLYKAALDYLTTPIKNISRSFDEKIIFIIYCLDPDLLLYKMYLATDIDETVRQLSTYKPTTKLSPQITDYLSQMSSIIGISDPYLLKYEEKFFNTFLKGEQLLKGVKVNKLNQFLSYSPFVRSFASISEERYQELIDISILWEESNHFDNPKTRLSTLTYNIMAQAQLLGLKNIKEQFALFILLADKDLDMLRIYEEESKIQNIRRRSIDKLGFFYQPLIKIERLFHQRFCPELEVNPWTM